MKLKIALALMSLTVLVNCGKQGLSQQAYTDTATSVETPAPTPELTEGASDMTDVNKPVTSTNNDGGVLGAIGNFFSGLFGGGSNNNGSNGGNVVGEVIKCGVLPNLLKFGVSYFTGGNVLIGNIVGNVANSLLKCGADNTLLSLIPQGSSDPQQLMDFLGQILQKKDAGQNIISLIETLKNPKDVSGLINVLNALVQKTNGDSKLRDVLNLFIMFQASNGNLNDSCGSMNPMACQVFNAINALREQYQLPNLQFSATCSAAAQDHSVDMAVNQFLSHFSSNGDAVKERLNKLGIGAPWAELIVKGSQLKAQDALNMWLSSESQRAKLLSTVFSSVGVGYSNGYFTVCFNK